MYTWEIIEYLKREDYLIEAEDMLYMCKNSPQIIVRGYNPEKDNFYIITREADGKEYFLEFQIYNKKLGEEKLKSY